MVGSICRNGQVLVFGQFPHSTQVVGWVLCRKDCACGDVKNTVCGHDANQNSTRERERERERLGGMSCTLTTNLSFCYPYQIASSQAIPRRLGSPFPSPIPHSCYKNIEKKYKTISQNRNTLYFTDEVALCFPEVRLASAMSPHTVSYVSWGVCIS